MKEHPEVVIACPECGYEYLPAEIFFPDEVFGRPDNIIRTEKGKIEFYTNESFDFKEEFTCINCGCSFLVTGNVVFETKESEKINFDEDHITEISLDVQAQDGE